MKQVTKNNLPEISPENLKQVNKSLYYISRCGRIFRFYKGWRKDPPRLKELSPKKNQFGYLVVGIKYLPDGKRHTVAIHRLVAQAFIPNPENKPEVNHLDGKKENNNVSNLAWCTKSENQRHALRKELSKLPNQKLTPRKVKNIRKSPLSNVELAKKYDVASETIRGIRNRRGWCWVD